MVANDTELLILGILRRAPMSAYQVNRIVRGHAHLYRSLKFGNVYNAIKRLAESGLLIGRSAKAVRGPRDTKVVFRLSAAGNRRFGTLLTNVITDIQATDAAFEIALVLLGQLPRSEALQMLLDRLNELTQQEKRLKRLRGDPVERSGGAHLSVIHASRRLHSGIQFLHEAIQLLKTPKWAPEWLENEASVADPASAV